MVVKSKWWGISSGPMQDIVIQMFVYHTINI